jgi:GNAT superfamily N-acetyltransferase
MTVTIRRAGPDDAAGLLELRATMFEAMHEAGVDDPGWRTSFAAWVRGSLGTDALAAFVAEHPTGGLVAAAVGQINLHAPSPHNPAGLSGHVSNVVTKAEFRGQGLARRCVESLVEWFTTSTSVADLNLSATSDGALLYRQLGFVERAYPSMRLVIRR